MKYKLEYIFIGLVIVGFLLGYFFAQMTPYHDRSKGKASALILGCIDPRYTHDLAWYVTHNQELHGDYDLINLAGASLGVLQTTHPGWQNMFFDHVQLALDLHGISEVWVFDHLDCGMYKATLKLETDEDPSIHLKQQQDLKKLLTSKHPNLKFKGYLIAVNGGISQII
jgi:carbonic anhydrase